MKRTVMMLAVLMLVAFAHAGLAQGKSCAVDAGPIWSQSDANVKCPKTCAAGWGSWDGQWWTTVPNKMSVCECLAPAYAIDAGPLWNQQDADAKCPGVCQNSNGVWDGQWWTTVPGKMSVCECLICKAKPQS
jgi:hypothetical protein